MWTLKHQRVSPCSKQPRVLLSCRTPLDSGLAINTFLNLEKHTPPIPANVAILFHFFLLRLFRAALIHSGLVHRSFQKWMQSITSDVLLQSTVAPHSSELMRIAKSCGCHVCEKRIGNAKDG